MSEIEFVIDYVLKHLDEHSGSSDCIPILVAELTMLKKVFQAVPSYARDKIINAIFPQAGGDDA